MFTQSRCKQAAQMFLAAILLVSAAGAFAQNPPATTPAPPPKARPGRPAANQNPHLNYKPGVPPKFWSIATAETVMERYPDYRAAYHGNWTYVHGYTFYAFEMISKATGDKKYIDYMQKYLDNFVDKDGNFVNANINSLDNMMTGNSIIAMYELTKDERYKKAAEAFRRRLDTYPKSSDGQFWHGTGGPNMWIDGIFMGQMMLTRYGKSIGDSQFCWDTATRQFTVFAKHCLKGDSGLYLHAWTETKPTERPVVATPDPANPKAKGKKKGGFPEWADPVTHNSPEVWSEGLGWYALVVVETLSMLPKDHPQYNATLDIYKRMMAGLKKTQDEKTGGWWMIVDKGTTPGNWIDPSGTGMFLYAIQRGIELGLLDKAEYGDCPKRGWECLKRDFAKINDQGLVDIVGGGDGITIKKDFQTYVSVKRPVNAKETVGAFLWASAIMEKPELEKLKK